MLRTELAIGYQIHFPLRRSQQRQRRSAKLTSPGSSGFLTSPTSRARPRSHPKRAHPARQAHQPLGPGTASRPPKQHPRAPEANTQAESTLVIPTVPAPRCYPPKHPNTPTFGHRSSRRQPSRQQRPSSFRESRDGPSRACAESKADPSHRHSHMATTRPPA